MKKPRNKFHTRLKRGNYYNFEGVIIKIKCIYYKSGNKYYTYELINNQNSALYKEIYSLPHHFTNGSNMELGSKLIPRDKVLVELL